MARWPEGAQDLGRRDVLPQMSSRTEVLLCLILSATPPCSRSGSPPCCSCPACWPPSAVAGARDAGGGRWAATGRRCWCCAGFSTAPGWPSWPPTTGSAGRRPTAICTRASTSSPQPRPGYVGRCWPLGPPGIRTSPWTAPLVRTDRVRAPGPTARGDRPERRVDLWWSGKHTAHGGNIQVIAAPDGWPIWTSRVRPGREHDTTALRADPEALPLLAGWTDEGHAVLADLGYEGERDALTTPIKTPAGRRLTGDERCVNLLHAAVRAPAERGNSLLKTTFKALRRVSLCPWRIGAIAAARPRP